MSQTPWQPYIPNRPDVRHQEPDMQQHQSVVGALPQSHGYQQQGLSQHQLSAHRGIRALLLQPGLYPDRPDVGQIAPMPRSEGSLNSETVQCHWLTHTV